MTINEDYLKREADFGDISLETIGTLRRLLEIADYNQIDEIILN